MDSQSLERLWEACGGHGQAELRIARSPGARSQSLVLHLPFAVVGRSPGADVCLEGSHVSRRHAYLQVVNGRLFCVDLKSRFGTYWDAEPNHSGWVDADVAIRIDDHFLSAGDVGHAGSSFFGEDFNPLMSRYPGHLALPDVTLEFFQGTTRQITWRMNRVLALVGRSDHCRVRLADASVSRFHCSLLRTPHGVYAIDLLGLTGLWVNGKKVRWACLTDGDQLRVGKFSIHLRHAPPLLPDLRLGAPAVGWPANVAPAGLVPMASPTASAVGLGNLSNLVLEAFNPSVPQPVRAEAEGAASVGTFGPPAIIGSGPLSQGELTESVIVPLVNQFALMQQQMFDQFQQTIFMLVQMFSSLHKDQLALIREELDRLDGLTRELHSLEEELRKRSNDDKKETPAVQLAPANSAAALAAQMQPALAASNGNGGEPMRLDKEGSQAASRAASASEKGKTEHVEAGQSEQQEAGGGAGGGSSADGSPDARSGPPRPAKEKDIHVWLYHRIAALQQERQSRWKTIMNFIKGSKSPGL
jgi:pSer/pThr/pTyr-binding forkhead associated (FHA) protein